MGVHGSPFRSRYCKLDWENSGIFEVTAAVNRIKGHKHRDNEPSVKRKVEQFLGNRTICGVVDRTGLPAGHFNGNSIA
jgi:hypothetical protein